MVPSYSPIPHQCPLSVPDEVVEDIIKTAWSQRHMPHRWQFYRSLLGLRHQWRSIALHVCLRFVVLECPKDIQNYCRLVYEARKAIPDKDALQAFFSRTHIRADVAALNLSPMFPACKSLELTGEMSYRPRQPMRTARLDQWLRIPHLKSVAFLHSFYYLGANIKQATPPPTLTYIHYHMRKGGHYGPKALPLWLTDSLGNATQLRVNCPQLLTLFVGHAPKLEELILDLGSPTDPYDAIVAALEAGLLRGPQKKVTLITGLQEPACYRAVKETCQWLGISLERRLDSQPDTVVIHVRYLLLTMSFDEY